MLLFDAGIDQDGTKVVQWGASATSAVLSIWALCYFAQSARKESFVGSVMKGGSVRRILDVLPFTVHDMLNKCSL
jgi:hypothetical protein